MPLLKVGGDAARWTLGHPGHATAATIARGRARLTCTLLRVTEITATQTARL